MAFYIKPPNGRLCLSILETYAENRLQLLLKIHRCHGKFVAIKDVVEDPIIVAYSDCLIEGSKKDQVSHFMLRLACCLTTEMEDFSIKSESSLFEYRVCCSSAPELITMIKPIKRLHYHILKEIDCGNVVSEEMSRVLNIIEYTTTYMSWEELIDCYCTGKKGVYIVLPFQYCLQLVSKRLVVLENGMAFVPCTKLPEILKLLFELILRHGINVAKKQLNRILEDNRIWHVVYRLKHLFTKSNPDYHSSNTDETVRSEEVDRLYSLFPPCMSHLHTTLRESHRLRHYSRIQYTLFLKEIGVPVNEAVHFWRTEYSQFPRNNGKSHNGSHTEKSHSCEHNWDKSGKRYTYNIRHLYGMEGSRKNYRGHCCTSLQEFSGGAGETGGCPFSHFDQNHLQTMLTKEGINDNLKQAILESVHQRAYSLACQQFLNCKIHQCHSKPKQYYPTKSLQHDLSTCSAEKVCPTKEDNTSENKTTRYEPNILTVISGQTNERGMSTDCGNLKFQNHKTRTSGRSVKERNENKHDLITNNMLDENQESVFEGKEPVKKEYNSIKTEQKSQVYNTSSERNSTTLNTTDCLLTTDLDRGTEAASQGCFDHKSCPPSQCDSNNMEVNMLHSTMHFTIYKPVDYYKTFKDMVTGLHKQCS